MYFFPNVELFVKMNFQMSKRQSKWAYQKSGKTFNINPCEVFFFDESKKHTQIANQSERKKRTRLMTLQMLRRIYHDVYIKLLIHKSRQIISKNFLME